MATSSRPLAKGVREAIWKRDGGVCQLCLKPVEFGRYMHADHVRPVVDGGTDELDNLRTTHARCNMTRPDPVHLKAGRRPNWLTALVLGVLGDDAYAMRRREFDTDHGTCPRWRFVAACGSGTVTCVACLAHRRRYVIAHIQVNVMEGR